MPLTVSKPREFRCQECNCRCTRGVDGTEYGHQIGCPQRPAGLPKSGGGTSSYYDPTEAGSHD